MSLNHIILQGRLCAEPELRRTNNGTAIVNVTLAVDRDYTAGQEKQTDFISVTFWQKSAEFVNKWFTKGQLILVEGRLQLRDWTDKNGQKRTSAEIVSEKVHFCESKRDRDEASYAAAEREGKTYQPAAAPVAVEVDDEDDGSLPF